MVEVDRYTAEKVLDSFDSSLSLDNYVELTSGRVNTMYRLETDKGYFVLRIPERGAELGKLEKEILVLNLVAEKTSVRVPKVYYADVSKNNFAFKYMIFENIPGDNLNNLASGLTYDEARTITKQLADYQSQFHSIKFDLFGDPVEGGGVDSVIKLMTNTPNAFAGPFRNYDSLFETVLNYELGRLRGTEFEAYAEAVSKKADNASFDLIRPRLIHGDFKPSNIMINKGSVSGAIDFEWATAGNSEEEGIRTGLNFFGPEGNFKRKDELAGLFDEIYYSNHPRLDGAEERESVYSMLAVVDMMACYKLYVPESDQEAYTDNLDKRMRALLKKS